MDVYPTNLVQWLSVVRPNFDVIKTLMQHFFTNVYCCQHIWICLGIPLVMVYIYHNLNTNMTQIEPFDPKCSKGDDSAPDLPLEG
jgi:hypothetical protein